MAMRTPGSWTVWGHDGTDTIVWCGRDNVVVAFCHTGQTPVAEEEANARFIATAPDLLDMAEAVLAYQDHLPANVVRDIKAVIAKAKGES